MEFVWIGVLNYLRKELHVTDRAERFSAIQEITGARQVEEKIRELKPDLVLGNFTAAKGEGDYLTDTLPMTQPIGFGSGLAVLRRWAQLNKNEREGEWKHDERWFQEYYA